MSTWGGGGATFVADAGGITLALPEATAALHLDGAITLGLRPEHLFPGAGPRGGDMLATVELVEGMGAETMVHLRVGTERLVMRIPGDQEVPTVGELTCHADLSRAHYFDAATGARIDTSTEAVSA